METLLTIVVLMAIWLLGTISFLWIAKQIQKDIEFTYTYQNRYMDYLNSQGSEINEYSRLMESASEMQNIFSKTKLSYSYRAPFQGEYYHNYAIFLNGLPELRQAFSMGVTSQAEDIGMMINDVLLTCIGIFKKTLSDEKSNYKNPFKSFANGIRLIITAPLRIIKAFGLISQTGFDKLTNNFIFNLFNAATSIVGLVTGLFSIVTSWENVITTVSKFIS